MSDDLVSVPIANFVTVGASQARRAPGLIPLGPIGRIFCLRNGQRQKAFYGICVPGGNSDAYALNCIEPNVASAWQGLPAMIALTWLGIHNGSFEGGQTRGEERVRHGTKTDRVRGR